jgi:hypothetical protein
MCICPGIRNERVADRRVNCYNEIRHKKRGSHIIDDRQQSLTAICNAIDLSQYGEQQPLHGNIRTFPIFFDYLNLNTSYLVGDAYEACAPE